MGWRMMNVRLQKGNIFASAGEVCAFLGKRRLKLQ